MAETAAEVITDALQEILVQASEQPIEADEARTAIRYMNRFMFMLDANGVSLGYTEVDNLASPITIPAGAIMGLVKNLAILLVPQFEGVISPALPGEAAKSLKVMIKLGTTRLPTAHPSTLPIGSGNEGDNFNQDWHFFPGAPINDILAETSRSILLEDQTDVP